MFCGDFSKGKFRIREIVVDETTLAADWRTSVNPIAISNQLKAARRETILLNKSAQQRILDLDFNRNPITFKCRLYIIKALLFRSKDQSGKADPFVKLVLNNDTIVDDAIGRIHNTLEPVFGK